MHSFSRPAAVCLVGLVSFVWCEGVLGSSRTESPTPPLEATVVESTRHDTSPPLREQPQPPARKGLHISREHDVPPGLNELPEGATPMVASRTHPPVYQRSAVGRGAMPALEVNAEGLGTGFPGYSLVGVPPDTTGAVGDGIYMQWVNSHFVLFDTSDGSVVDLPGNDWRTGSSVWAGFGGPCQNSNDGDPIVLYDQLAERWFMSQFAVSPNYPEGPFYQCLAVSTADDPLGTWNRYEFEWPSSWLNDYPKFGLWPDGYYLTVNQFGWNATISNFTWRGAGVAVFDRAAMVAGSPTATMQYWNLGFGYGSLLPADLDGLQLPPADSPAYLLGLGSSAIQMWRLAVSWTDPGSSTLNGTPDVTVPIASFNVANSIDQPGTTADLSAIGGQLMFRAAYRNLGDHEAVVVNQTADEPAAVRWYEIRGLSATPTLHQEGAYSPDGDERWMGSVAMDGAGNIALGYSVSGATTSPSIRVAGRLADDPPGTIGLAETTVVAGSGHQNAFQGQNRWGDYSTMAVDPVDDCTFWYTQEYLTETGQFVWRTRVAAFRFPSCQSGLIFDDGFESGATDGWSATQP